MQCQINKLISKPCQREAVENIDMQNTNMNLWVCKEHLQQLIQITIKQTKSGQSRR